MVLVVDDEGPEGYPAVLAFGGQGTGEPPPVGLNPPFTMDAVPLQGERSG